jgi:NADPH:quinone reductase-like Zn-dependent oxidoreductase
MIEKPAQQHEQLVFCYEAGQTGYALYRQIRSLGYRREDFGEAVAHATAGRGVDVVINFVGAPYLDRNVRALAEGGRLVQVGLLGGGHDAKLSLDILLYRHLRIIGTVTKSRPQSVKIAMTARFRDRWLDAFVQTQLKPVIDSAFPLAEAAAAHRRMESGQAFGKIILAVD